MKSLVYILLSLTITLQAVVPCCLYDSCPEEKEHTALTEIPHKDSEEDGCGTCSPFSSCQTCQTGTITFHESRIIIPLLKVAKPRADFYYNHYTSFFLKKLYQPPKFA